jgi:hypothetical protein
MHKPNKILTHLLIIGILCIKYVFSEPEEHCHEKNPLIGSKKFDKYKVVDAMLLQTVKLDCHFW